MDAWAHRHLIAPANIIQKIKVKKKKPLGMYICSDSKETNLPVHERLYYVALPSAWVVQK